MMKNSIYEVNKGINKSIEFKGLRAQYIWYFGGLITGLMIVFAALYICGAGTLVCLALTGSAAAYGSISIFRLSRKYGEHGLMKAAAGKRAPKILKSYSRKVFRQLAR
ncbi:DUF4133 domain-containing protein [Mucilaginibacter angelicae]|uniref:DUF4133 domain-containing protein n=1 Tax=Mucilaginibacter angelicae TaxID=869718 RepID=A0ABV6L5D8_9SPHI